MSAPPEHAQPAVETADRAIPASVASATATTPPTGGWETQRPLITASMLFAGALALCLAGYLALSVPSSWFPSATPKSWTARDMGLARGTGEHIGDDMVITAPDHTGTAVVSINTDFATADYPVIAWTAFDLPENVEARLLWLSDYATQKVNTVQLSVVWGQPLPVSLAKNPAWLGRVKGLALLIHGPLTQPVRIRGVTIKPSGARELLSDRAREWLTFESWSGTSINTVAGGADLQDLPLPTLIAVAIALGAAACFALATRRRRFAMMLPPVVGAMFVIGWLILDARWMFNLERQVTRTAAQYQGKDWRERRLAAEDGPLFAFIEKAREKIPAPPVRVFMVADAHYFRDRGAYHLYPHNVYFDAFANLMPPSSQMRAGDYLVVYNRQGIEYDQSQQRLRWEGNPPVAAEAVLVEPGAALFRIR